MLYQFPTCGGLKFKILCAIWECQSFTKEKKGLGKIPHLLLVAKPLHSHSQHKKYFENVKYFVDFFLFTSNLNAKKLQKFRQMTIG